MTEPHISVQLYSVHQELANDLDGTLSRLSEIGFANVEAFNFVESAMELERSFARHNLTAPTGHALLVGGAGTSPDGLLSAPPAEATFEAAARLGIGTVIDPFVSPERWTSVDSVKRIAERLNDLAVHAATFGLRMGYHNHDAELRNQFIGKPALMLSAELLEPSVALEVDLYWAAAAGTDLPGLLGVLGERVIAVHIKDGPLRPGITTRPLPTDQRPAGTGDVPLLEALRANSSIEFAVVEFDHYEGDIYDGIAASRGFLLQELVG